VSALALAIGPVVGGFLTQQVSWRAIFFINPPIALIAVAVTLFAARESRDETVSRKIDFPGIASITVGLTALVLALVEGNSWHWGSARVIGLLAVAVDDPTGRDERQSDVDRREHRRIPHVVQLAGFSRHNAVQRGTHRIRLQLRRRRLQAPRAGAGEPAHFP